MDKKTVSLATQTMGLTSALCQGHMERGENMCQERLSAISWKALEAAIDLGELATVQGMISL